jgi:hypothetical protein
VSGNTQFVATLAAGPDAAQIEQQNEQFPSEGRGGRIDRPNARWRYLSSREFSQRSTLSLVAR